MSLITTECRHINSLAEGSQNEGNADALMALEAAHVTDWRADAQRPESIKVKAQDLKGAKVSITLKGWLARIFQHEYDHLQVRYFPFDRFFRDY